MRSILSTLLCLILMSSTHFFAAAQSDSSTINRGQYHGKLKKGIRQGFGECTWQDGRKYEGRWKDDLMHGKGTMTYRNGDRYTGDWKYGAKDGYGTYTWANGSTYVGAYVNGKKSGWGVLKQPNGSKHEGYWKNDMAHGKGKHVWPNGTLYYGDWKNNMREGSGVLEYSDGSVVQGEWSKDQYIPCKCMINMDSVDIASEYEKYEAVFVGAVTEIYQEDDGSDAIIFEVSQHWKGKHGFNRKVTLHANFTSCDFIFYEGVSYLIFANTGSNKFYRATKCSLSGELATRTKIVQQLSQQVVCKQQPVKTPFEIRDFDPVCGCDGKTYDNPYKAKAKGVGSWKRGACKE